MTQSLWTDLTGVVRPETVLHTPLRDATHHPFERVLGDAERTAGTLLSALRQPVRPRIGLLMANGEPWVRGLLAAARLGGAAVPIALPVAFPGFDTYQAHIRRIADDAALDAVLVDDTTARIATRLQAALPALPFVNITERPTGPVPRDLGDSGDSGDLAVIQYTSGSTSAPKGVALSHANVRAGLASLADGVDWSTEDDVMGQWVPLFHDMGLFLMLSAFARGSSVCLWRPSDFVRDTRKWLVSFSASAATAMPAPNFAFDYMVDAVAEGAPEGLDLSKWRVAYNAAEPVQQRTVDRFEAAFTPFGFRPQTMLPAYGMAEATLVATYADLHSRPRTLRVDRYALGLGETVRPVAAQAAEARPVVCVGKAVPGLEVRVGDGDLPLADGVVGEIQLHGPAVMRGYLNLPEAEQPFTGDGWLRTGDLAFALDDEFYIVGRLKDMIVIRGQNYYPEDVEEIVRQIPGVDRRHCAALGLTGAGEGDERIAVMFETSLDTDEAAQLVARIRTEIVDRLGFDNIEVVPVAPRSIPFTSSGKVKRQQARQMYVQSQITGPQRAGIEGAQA
ncbi:AMP-binding protein [Streptomyces sp. NPDC021093]|uniref:AMP-binding protein n=1 Tax=Streptomyces sp. NPDC021093 TaxID=3365112 RepID=UPI0037B956D8